MKKNSFLFSTILLASLYILSSSCNRTDYSEQISQIDSLYNQISHYSFQIDSIDSNAVIELTPIIQEDLLWISDSLSKELLPKSSLFLYRVRTGNKLLQNFPQEYHTLKKEFIYSLKQLSDLKKDLKNNSIEKVDASKYINDEKLAIKVLESHLNKMIKKLETMKDYPEVRKDFYLMVHEQGISLE